eukprot:CAMPEP_0204384468 /NCGR_PEP_ID=MMETSP0469-20131031/56894_1 /ASSEMBLY_ACC=CAM_ASM_000384 /TAXON_ID=2969 /ORGANISM="Oxyrrhis marina" /LENGTH=520 /DNA_ID=CAMNT_0051377097 /DNA_START=1 /DNA_END=1563 /DNA_ORIENTATION=+
MCGAFPAPANDTLCEPYAGAGASADCDSRAVTEVAFATEVLPVVKDAGDSLEGLGNSEADDILGTYRSGFQGLSLTEPLSDFSQYHFVTRIWRITGWGEWKTQAAFVRHLHGTGKKLEAMLAVTDIGGSDVARWQAGSPALRAAEGLLPRALFKSGQTSSLRQAEKVVTAEKIQLWFLMVLAVAVHKLFDHDLHKHTKYHHLWHSSRAVLESSMHCFDPGWPAMKTMLLEDPAKCTNCLYFLRRIGVLDAVEAAWRQYQHVWDLDTLRRPRKLDLYLYGLTHFVLNESIFYQLRIDLEMCYASHQVGTAGLCCAYRWILNYFEANIDAILGLANPDIIAEVGLCFKVCSRTSIVVYQRCLEYVSSCVRFCSLERRTLLFSKDSDVSRGLRRSEHSNCVGLLLLAPWPSNLFWGPHYSGTEWERILATALDQRPRDLQVVPCRTRKGTVVESYRDKRMRLESLGVLRDRSPAATVAPRRIGQEQRSLSRPGAQRSDLSRNRHAVLLPTISIGSGLSGVPGS